MKKHFFSFFLILLCLLLSSCAQQPILEQRVLVSLVQTPDFTVEENGIWIYPGQNVSFRLTMPSGAELTGTNYSGPYYIWKENGVTRLELRNVTYPTQIELNVTTYYRHIAYDPNGGTGTGGIFTYDITHRRPNTSIGTDLFSREGYTLTCWNTSPDGSGTRVGLGSRVTVPEEGLTLYAQWVKWAEAGDFQYAVRENAIAITGYQGAATEVVIPEVIDDLPVTTIASNAFSMAPVRSVILPKSIVTVETGAFSGSTLESLLLYDNVEKVSDAAFSDCDSLRTLYINAIEAPYGYLFRRESLYADKVDLLIGAQGRNKLVFYGGCSMWYNLNGQTVQDAIDDYTVINMGVNGTMNSDIQMQIMGHFLEEGDIFFHTPELTSDQQLLLNRTMGKNDDKLWCGLENNYDLFSLVDIRGISGVFDSFCDYLTKKTESTDDRKQYTDSDGRLYMDATGSIPFSRTEFDGRLAETETVSLDPEALEQADLSALASFYRDYEKMGVRVYVSYACVDFDAVPESQQALVSQVDGQFRRKLEQMDCPVLVSTLWDFLYEEADFYDSAYHLRSPAVERNTATWLRDLKEQMAYDGAGSGE